MLLSGIGCGQADTALAPRPEAPAAAPGGDGTGPRGDAGSGAVCPPPEGSGSCGGPVWGRDVATGTCCEYSSFCVVPQFMARFNTLEECQTDCRCRDLLQSDDGGQKYSMGERTTLECHCQYAECPVDLATTERQWCDSSGAQYATRLEGCGMIALRFEGGYTNETVVFDAQSGALVGLSADSDIRSEPCWAFGVLAGRDFDCADVSECTLCPLYASSSSTVTSTLPHCE